MFLPIGQENSEVRRHPWVSYVVIGLNVLLFLIASTQNSAWFDRFSASTEEVFSYIVDNPYLEVPPEMAQYLSEEDMEFLAQQRAAFLRDAPGHRKAFLDLEQQKLDELVSSWDAIRRQSFSYRLGFVPAEPHMLNAVSCLFVHAGLFHLLGNMLFFFVTGPFLEDLYGRPIFAIFYVVAGIVATMMHTLMFPESGIPLVGASGAVAGIMGAFLIRLGKSRMKFLFLPIPIIPTFRFTFHIRAFVFLPFWLGEQVLYASIAPEGGVAWWAHIGGFLFGMMVAIILKVAHVEERYVNPAIENQISFSTHPDFEKAIEARCAEQFDKARAHINKVLSDEPGNLDAWAESFNIAIASNNDEEAGRIAAKLLGLYARSGEKELAFQFGDEAVHELGKNAPAQLYLAMAGLYERERDIRSAIDCYHSAYERSPEAATGYQALFRCGKLYMRMGNKKTAREVFMRARTHSACLEPDIIDRVLVQLEGLPDRSAN